MLGSILSVESKRIEVVDRQSGVPFVEKVYGDDAMKVFYGSAIGAAFTEKFLTSRLLSNIYGAYNDSGASKHKIEDFVSLLNIDVHEAEKDLSSYSSFNDFFARKLKPAARPITQVNNAVACPGDGRLMLFPAIDDATISNVKWAPISLVTLFQDNHTMVERFRGGSCGVLRLCPSDYHRFHFPISGRVGMTRTVPGMLHSVSPYALEQKIPVYCMNKRTICEVDSPQFGKVVLMEVGAMFVGSIVQTYRSGANITLGDEKGYFKFGGSTTLFFFEKGAVRWDDDLVNYCATGRETYVRMGERLGICAR